MKKKILKIFSVIGIMMIMLSCFSVTAFALDPPSGGGSGGGSGDVAGAIENTWNTASEQIKQVVDNVPRHRPYSGGIFLCQIGPRLF